MLTQFAAIPTTYNGVRFRSRLEAKWAATFDRMGWLWEYEPIDLNGWIPDFLVQHPKFNSRPWLVEVKPINTDQDKEFRETQKKIERVFGVKTKIDDSIFARILDGPHEIWDWDSCPDLDYTPHIVGANLIVLGIHDWPGTPRLTPDAVGIGWSFAKHMGWWACYHYAEQKALRAAWNDATNVVQWKAPR